MSLVLKEGVVSHYYPFRQNQRDEWEKEEWEEEEEEEERESTEEAGKHPKAPGMEEGEEVEEV